MFRFAFLFILIIHGLIHLLGFVKAFAWADINELTQPITKPLGLVWLVAVLFFMLAGVLYGFRNNYWWVLGFAAVLISQILILYFWKDARFGTLPNVLILLVSIIAYANFNFSKIVDSEISLLLSQADLGTTQVITDEMIVPLPAPVQRWLKNSGVIGKEAITGIFIRQKAQMKMKPEQKKWSEAEAEQYITTQKPAFIWRVKMQMMSFLEVVGRDKFVDGKGEMLIKLLALLPVVNSKDNDKINTGALQRYLGEMVWFPSATLNSYITWKPIDEFSAQATMSYGGTTGSGTFYFEKNENFSKFSAMRYMGGEEDAELKEWVIEVQESKTLDGINIPVKMTATWKLDQGDWTWLELEVTEYHRLESRRYNDQSAFPSSQGIHPW